MRCAPLHLALLGLLTACAGPSPHAATTYELLPFSEVRFDPLNPARGDQSPEAGTLFGDRNGAEATGFLFRPVDGFESPPHIHNVSYRGIVIRGEVHNDEPAAERLWLPARSYWTQPKGDVHITAARGSATLAYIEIDSGPYLVLPVEEAFSSGEEPINVHASNLVWVEAPGARVPAGVEFAYLYEKRSEPGRAGTLVRLPGGTRATLSSPGPPLRAVVIAGVVGYRNVPTSKETPLVPGSTFASHGPAEHRLFAEDEVLLYLRSEGPFELTGR